MSLRGTMRQQFEGDRNRAIALSRSLLRQNPIVLDTETTGLGNEDEICEIAVVRHDGETLLNARVRPIGPISPEASAVHGISDEDVASELDLGGVLSAGVLRLLVASPLTSYNVEFDLRLIRQSAAACGRYDIMQAAMGMSVTARPRCLMQMYSRYHGARQPNRSGHTWQTLDAAARQQELEWEGEPHTALGDALMALRLLRHMAETQYDS